MSAAAGVCGDCVKWSRKYTKIEAGRNALRQTVGILEKRIEQLTQPDSALQKDLKELRSFADFEREARTKECDKRVALEKEVDALKSELCSVQKEFREREKTFSADSKVSDLENRILELTRLVEKEKSRADIAFENAQVEKNKAAEAWEAVKLEKCMAEEDKRRVCTESKKVQEYKIQLDACKNEVAEFRTQLVLATSKTEEANTRLERERKKTSAEQKRINVMKAEVEKQKNLIGAYEKKLADEKINVDNISCKLEEERKNKDEMLKTTNELQKKINDLQASSKYLMMRNKATELRVENSTTHLETEKSNGKKRKKCVDSETAEVVKHKALMPADTMKSVEEKHQKHKLTHMLQGIKETVETSPSKFMGLQNMLIAQSNDKLMADALPEMVTCAVPFKCRSDGQEPKPLQGQMMTLKANAKRKANKLRNSIVKELDSLKQKFFQYSSTMKFLDPSFVYEAEGDIFSVKSHQSKSLRSKKRKSLNLEPPRHKRVRKNSLRALNMPSNLASHHPKQPLFLPYSGVKVAESKSFAETDSKLEPPAGCSYKNMYATSAKCSSGASFSDSLSINSHGKLDSCTTSSILANGISLQMTDSVLFEDVAELAHSDKPRTMSNAVPKILSNDFSGGEPAHNTERKGLLSVLNSRQYSLSDRKKIQMHLEKNISNLLSELQCPLATTPGVGMVCTGPYDRSDKSCNENKIIHKQKVSSPCFPAGSQFAELNFENPELKGVASDLGKNCPAVPANSLSIGYMTCKSINVASSSGNSRDSNKCFDQANEYYVILLGLDNLDEERHFRIARDNMLSPLLPEVKLQRGGDYCADKIDLTIEGTSNAKFSNPNCIHVDDSQTMKEQAPWTACKPLVGGDRDDCFNVKECTRYGNCDKKTVGSNLEAQVRKETRYPSEPLHIDVCSKLCVVHSETIDRGDVSRIFHAAKNATSQCHLSSPPDVLLKTVLDFINNTDLLPKDKSCAFFSLVLAASCVIAAQELSHQIRESNVVPNSFMTDTFSAIIDVDIRNCIEKTLCLQELLNLLEEFIMEGRIWLCLAPDRNPSKLGDSSVSVLADDMNFFLEAASTEQLVVASTLLASLCVSFDEVEFVFHLSYNLLRLRKYNNKVCLSVIHVFAQLTGRKFLTSSSSSLLTGVVKSLVLLLESSHSPYSHWPFSEEAVSVDLVIFKLVERLESLMETAKTQIPPNGNREEIAYNGTSGVRSSSSMEETFLQFTDMLSLLELIANYVSWDMVSSKVVPQLLVNLDRSTINVFSVAIIFILGQFGRLGVSANGLEDIEVGKIRCQLIGMMCIDSSRNFTLPIQVAAVSSLFKFIDLEPSSILCSAELSAPGDKASSACQIRRWFASLSEEQQFISREILKATPLLL